MKFFQLYPLFLVIFTLICEPSFCDEQDIETDAFDNFWDWAWGVDANETEGHKPMDHIKEEIQYHYGNKIDLKFDSIPELELEFYIFNLHDFDKNQKLDGLELLSMLDRHDSEGGHFHHNPHSLEQNIAVIDLLLRSDDKNGDGFLDYNEFKSAKSKHKIKGL